MKHLLLPTLACMIWINAGARAQPISQLPAASGISPTDAIPATQAGTTRKVTIGQINAAPMAAAAGEAQRALTAESGNANAIVAETQRAQGVEGGKQDVVSSNAALKAYTGQRSLTVWRTGYTNPGDGGGAPYSYSQASCTLNGGNGDNGSQVKPNTGGGCWIADLSAIRVTPMIWGAVGNSVADDSAAVLAAGTALAGHTMYLGPHLYGLASGVAFPAQISIQGDGPGIGTVGASGFQQLTPNINLITLPSASRLSNAYLYADGLSSTTGTVLTFPATGQGSAADGVYIQGGCIAVDLQGNTSSLRDVIANNFAGAGCGGVRVGHGTQNSNTVDNTMINVTTVSSQANPADYGMLVEDAGGLVLSGKIDNLYSKVGLKVFPGGSGVPYQYAIWLTSTGSYLADTTRDTGVLIDTGSGGGHPGAVQGLEFNASWASSVQTGDGVVINNTGGGTLAGIHFHGHRGYNNHNNAATVNAGSDVTFDDSHLCGNPGTGVAWGSGVSDGQIHGGKIGTCDGFATASAVGVSFAGGNNTMQLTDADLTGSTAPISGTPGGNSIVRDNIPIDNTGPWTISAPAVSASVGSLTTASSQMGYRHSSHYFYGSVTISVTSNGSGSGALQIVMPYAAARGCVWSGRENGMSGKMLQGLWASGSSVMSIFNFDGSYPASGGASLILTGLCETTS